MKKTFTSEISKISFIIVLLLLSNYSFGQLQVTNTANPTSAFTPITLIENVFIGQGMAIDTIIYKGDPEQVGYFQNGNAAIGISDGILISSGNAEDAVGPNSAGNTTTQYNTNSTTSPLVPIASGNVNDFSEYTIVFTPTSGTLSFRYVFASDEYPEYAPSAFNDVFGFFISGPNNALPLSNIALIPGTTTQVSINNVHAGSNAAFYNDNVGGANHEYDGYTTVLTATANVIPCQQYTIVLAISDVTDWSWDSGVFLEGGSFQVDGIIATPVTPSPDLVLVEGCGSGTMDFSLLGIADSQVPITYTIGGTATMGVDYDTIPLSGTIPVGGTTFSFPVNPLEDGVADSLEYIEFIYNVNPCVVDTIRMFIKDNELLTANIPDIYLCTGDSSAVDATSPIPTPPPYTYSDGSTQATPSTLGAVQYPINISGFPYPVIGPGMIESICLDITSLVPSFYDIFLIAPDGSFLELTTGNGGVGNQYGNTCFTPNTSDPLINSVTGPFSGNYQPEGFWNFLNGAPANGTWILQIGYNQGTAVPGTLDGWSINFAPIYDIQYSWSPTTNLTPNSTSPIVTLSPPTTTDYIVTLNDTYGCMVSDTTTVFVDDQLPAPIATCGNITNSSVEFTWLPITNVTNYEVNINNTGWIPANGTLSHIVSGLGSNIAVTIEVRAIQPAVVTCTLPPLIGTHVCTTSSCALTTNIATQTDASCNGGTDGSVTIGVPTGIPPYTFSIGGNPTQPTGVFNNLAAGVYNIVITDDANCSETQVVTIGEPNPIVIAFTTVDATCNGATDGSITATATNGMPNYTYNWNTTPPQTTATISSLAAGNYIVTATDMNGCTGVNDTTITEPLLITFTQASTNASCNAGSDGTITLTSTIMAMPVLEYSIDSGITWFPTGIFTGLTAGTYNPVVRYLGDGCDVAGTPIVITEPTAITMTTASTDATCNSSGDGTATVTPSGGTGTYTYVWNTTPPQTTATATGLNQGTFAVTVTDANSCLADTTVDVNVPTPIVLTMVNTSVTCFNGNDGTATVTASGGNGAFTYAWNTTPVETTANATALAAGTWIVTVTDGNGCFDTAQVQLANPAQIFIDFVTVDATCNGAIDGTIQANVANGTPNYTYNWNTIPAQTTQTATGLAAGNYIVTVTDMNGCTNFNDTTITEPVLITFTQTSTNVSCNGGSDATITITNTTIGNPPIQYSIDGGLTYVSNSGIFTGLSAGIYIPFCGYPNGTCAVAGTQIVITEPTQITTTTASTDATCNSSGDGTATVTPTGGTGTYTYLWDVNAASQTAATATGLNQGTFAVTITDANNCQIDTTVDVNVPSPIILTLTSTDLSCLGASDGTATVTATGGNGTYTYAWSTTPVQTTTTANGLSSGTWTVTVTDGNGCFDTAQVQMNSTIVIGISFATTDVSCNNGNDGTATATAVTNGNAPFNYTWNTTPNQNTQTAITLTAGTHTVTITDAIGCMGIDSTIINEPTALVATTDSTTLACYEDGTGTATVTVTGGTSGYTYLWDANAANQTTATATNLQAGTYDVTTTDALGCTIVASAIVTQPDSITLVMTNTAVSCNAAADGTTTVTATGGTAPYTYAWSTTPVQNTATAIGLSGGLYTVTVTDANNCFKVDTVSVYEPEQITITEVQTNVSCFGGNDGTITITNTTIGNPTIEYSIDNGANFHATGIFTGLTAGTYNPIGRFPNGNCAASGNLITITQPDSITITTASTNITCNSANDGTATASAIGGTGNLTFAWNTTPVQTTANIINLAAGIYTVTVTDDNGCTNTASVTITEPTAITYTTAKTDLLCNNDNSGTATITASGGTGTLTYAWSNGETTAAIINLAAGTYIYTVTDASNCFITDNITITEPAVLTSSTTSTDISCFGANDGTGTVTPVGGTMPYTYIWSNGMSTAMATALSQGTTGVTVTDANGCMTTDSVIINEPTQIITSIATTNATCNGVSDGTATITTVGGVGPYTYSVNGVVIPSNVFSNLAANTYNVLITAVTGCTATDNFVITEPTAIVLSSTMTMVACSGGNDGTASVTANGGTGAYTYLWSSVPTQTTQTATGLGTGTYTVTVTDANGCSETSSIQVTTPNPLSVTFAPTNIGCAGESTGAITTTVNGGIPAYTFAWNNGMTAQNLSNIPAGNYILTITDANGCSIVDSVELTEPGLPLAITTTFIDVSCFGGNDGTAAATVTGGTAPYTYSWNAAPNQFTAVASNLVIGTYTVSVTDINGCSTTATVVIDEPSAITLLMTETSASCFGAIDGTATVNASGGTPTGTNGYTYVWNSTPQQTTQTAINLIGGQTYTVIVTDSLGCTSTDNITISQPAEIVLTTTQVNVTCDGFFDASATVNVTGGTPAYAYLWDANANNQTSQTAIDLASGTYEVTVTDFNGCTETTSVTIIEPNPLFINTMATAVACKGDASGTASATFSGGTMPYSSVWSFNNTAASQITNVPAGTYFVTLTDANGCQLVDSVIINEPNEDLGTNAEKVDNICYGDRNGTIKLTGTGGTFPYLYSLDGENYSNSNQFVGLDAADYTVYTKDANGCTFDQIVRITEPAEFTVETVEDREIVFGDPARLDVTPTNGVEPIIYTWTPDETLDCNPCQSPKVDSLLNDTYFEVFAVDANGCEAEDGMFVRVTTPRRVFIATGMTPNDDGNNDILYVQGGTGTLEVTSFQVFDRWGELVFEATETPLNDTSFGWDGTYKGQDAPGGTYVWAVQVEFTDGRIVTYQGSTSLIR